VDDPKEYWSMLYQEGVKDRETRGGKYFELIKDASRRGSLYKLNPDDP
jgi:hypothetical protein